MNKKVSVVMVSYHTGAALYSAIASVLMQPSLSQLIIVDNGNPPDVLARLRQMTLSNSALVLVSGQGNVGFAAGCNLGVRVAEAEYVMLLNPDTLLPPDALQTLVDALENTPHAMVAAPLLLNPDGSEQRGGRRRILTPFLALSEVFGLSRFGCKGLGLHHMPCGDEVHDVPVVSGACMLWRKSEYQAIGGMDEGYFLHVDDLDICKRVADMGKRILCVPSVKLVHMRSTSGEAPNEFIEKQKAIGLVRYFEKNFSDSFFGVLPLLRACIWGRYHLRKRYAKKHSDAPAKIEAQRRFSVLAGSYVQPPSVPELAEKTVLVSGATSQLGIFVVQHLLASGAWVLAISRNAPLPFFHPRLKWLRQDITSDSFSLDGFLADALVHCAPQWFLPRIFPMLAVAEVKQIVAIGSTSVFSKAGSDNGFEKDIVAKHTVAEAENLRLGAEASIATTILRPTLVYGAGLDKNVSAIASIIKRFGRFLLYPPAMGKRQPVHAEDVALAALHALVHPQAAGKAYNISGGEILSFYQMVERIFVVMGKKPRIITTSLLPCFFNVAGMVLRKPHVNGEVARRMNEDLVFFHDDARRDFGYNPRVFLSRGLRDIEGEKWHG